MSSPGVVPTTLNRSSCRVFITIRSRRLKFVVSGRQKDQVNGQRPLPGRAAADRVILAMSGG
jgi:hypothetical protein